MKKSPRAHRPAGLHPSPAGREIVRNLQVEGLSLVEFRQGFLSMGPASAEFLRLDWPRTFMAATNSAFPIPSNPSPRAESCRESTLPLW
jgi:hypothetical protein